MTKAIDFGMAIAVSAVAGAAITADLDISFIDGFGINLLTQILWRVCK